MEFAVHRLRDFGRHGSGLRQRPLKAARRRVRSNRLLLNGALHEAHDSRSGLKRGR